MKLQIKQNVFNLQLGTMHFSDASNASAAPLHWNVQQKQEFYRSLAPAPPPPPGKNYQITYTPLDDPTDQKSSVENLPTTSKFSTPMRLSIDGGSTSSARNAAISAGGASPTSGSNSPPVFLPKNSSLLMLRDNTQ
uniref:Uncharacterized protein n=2 Tax=Caenorhabditis japonica TaxID=281687 RepID=A0A8R1IHE0_CAEJA